MAVGCIVILSCSRPLLVVVNCLDIDGSYAPAMPGKTRTELVVPFPFFNGGHGPRLIDECCFEARVM